MNALGGVPGPIGQHRAGDAESNEGRQMMRTWFIAACLLLVTAGTPDANNHVTAKDMLPACLNFVDRADAAPLDQGVCIGRVDGVKDASPTVCAPAGLPFGRSVRAVIAYIQARPDRLHERFTTLAEEALAAAYPCQAR